jgi:NAD(P)H-hydrate epimerase
MQRAGRAVFEALLHGWPALHALSICCGKGNNAGDGYVVAELAQARGLTVELIQIGNPEELQGDAALARDAALAAGVAVIRTDDGECIPTGDVVVDALLGTGLEGPPRGPYATLIKHMNNSGCPVVAIDIPSGLQADTGAASGAVVQAHTTITFIGRKIGLHTGAGMVLAGQVLYSDLGVGRDVHALVESLDWLTFDGVRSKQPLPRANAGSYKQSLGHIAVLGGDLSMGGAPLMAAEAALRTGVGMVTVVTRGTHRNAMLSRRPELMVVDADDGALTAEVLAKADLLIVGPGLGRAAWGDALLTQALALAKPMLIDADGLYLLGQRDVKPTAPTVITPHSGEAAVLLDCATTDVEADRLQAARALAESVEGVAVLKGAGSIIASGSGVECRILGICAHGNPGMATAGMGDVLAGIVGGLFAQIHTLASGQRTEFLPPAERAALLGTCLHGLAADRAAGRVGQASLLATDIVPEMISVLTQAD